jgi:polysaccharide pyruvyl transferase WcaK-like protein
VLGNQGDIASRWGIVNALHLLGLDNVSIFCDSPKNVPPTPYPLYSYGKLRNLLFTQEGRKAIKASDTVFWAGGLDLQDDSSLMKVIYLWVIFRVFHFMGLRIWCFLQGAGPLNSLLGRKFARGVLKSVDLFVARDSGSLKLLQEIYPRGNYMCAHDGIFLPGLENSMIESQFYTSNEFKNIFSNKSNPVIGFNIRMWFHFNSGLLPYQFNQKAYQRRSKEPMKKLVASSCDLISKLRETHHAKVVLLSGYQPGIVPWEDDAPWLAQIKNHFQDDADVILLDSPMTTQDYFKMMSSFDIVIAMRLHTVLVALRFGVPGINLSYTLKGSDILTDMDLEDYAIDIDDFLRSPDYILEKVKDIADNMSRSRDKIRKSVTAAIEKNEMILKHLLEVDKT